MVLLCSGVLCLYNVFEFFEFLMPRFIASAVVFFPNEWSLWVFASIISLLTSRRHTILSNRGEATSANDPGCMEFSLMHRITSSS